MNRNFTPYIYILLFFYQSYSVFSQNLSLILSSKPENKNVFSKINYQKIHPSEVSIYKELDSITIQLQKLGFIYSQLDTIKKIDSIYYATYLLGDQIKSIQIFYPNTISQKALKKITTKITSDYFEVPFIDISKTLQSIVKDIETEGNSFSQVFLQNITIDNSLAKADLIIKKSEKRKIDKIIVEGYDNFPKSYIQYALRVKKGNVFNLQTIKQISTEINSIPFVTEIKEPQVLFTNDSTYLYLYLQKQKSNTFDGLIGFSSKTEGSGLDFNGYLNVKFQNIFNRGEMISLYWKSNGNNSQQFDLTTKIPYLFNLPLSPEVSLNLYRQDTTYNNVNFNVGVSFDLIKNGKVAALINSENSNNLQNEDTYTTIKSFQKNNYGINFQYKIPNNDFLFTNKFKFDFSTFYGAKRIEQTKYKQTKLSLFTHYLWSINKKNYFFIQNQTKILNADNLLSNELFRIGGINTIRGFNEESIFASAYSILNIEYRYKTNKTSFFYTITDYAYIANQINNTTSSNYSLGIGYSFLTKTGLFNLSYALGKFQNNPFNFNNSKFHIKIVNFF